MRCSFLLAVSCCLLLGVLVTPVSACLNDREVNRSEREFKSQYQERPDGAQPSSESPSVRPAGPLAFLTMGVGVFLLAGSVVVSLNRPRGGA